MNILPSIESLEKNGYFIIDDFLTSEELILIHQDFTDLYKDGKFKRAGIGKNTDFQLNNDVRKDETYWLEPLSLNATQLILWKKLEALKQQLNESLFLGLWEFEAHYSYYPIGGLYLAHVDRFSSDDKRTISMVLYLNQEWVTADGGELRIHQKEPLAPIDINPIDGKLVCFFSADVLHEVLISKKSRMSFAGWWKRR